MKNVSLATAKLLRAAGWENDEIKNWWCFNDYTGKYQLRSYYDDNGVVPSLPAPDATDLLEALPVSYEKDGMIYSLNIHNGNTRKDGKITWSVNYSDFDTDKMDIQTPLWKFDNIAEAAAYVWLALKKEGII